MNFKNSIPCQKSAVNAVFKKKKPTKQKEKTNKQKKPNKHKNKQNETKPKNNNNKNKKQQWLTWTIVSVTPLCRGGKIWTVGSAILWWWVCARAAS